MGYKLIVDLDGFLHVIVSWSLIGLKQRQLQIKTFDKIQQEYLPC